MVSFLLIYLFAGETNFFKSYIIIETKLEKIFNSEERVELNELISIGISKVTAYLALLFLTADGKCDLQQDEFYSDLYVVKNNDDRTVESEN